MTTKPPMPRRDEYTDLAGMLGVDAPTAPRYPVRSIGRDEPRRAPRIGFLSPAAIETAFLVLLYLGTLLLAVLSVLGTFYGLVGQDAPVNAVQIARDILEARSRFVGAFVLQLVLTLSQYGARQWARRDRRWWFGYLAALALSVWYNIQAYADPLIALHVPWLVAWCIIVAGDVLPEFIAVRKP